MKQYCFFLIVMLMLSFCGCTTASVDQQPNFQFSYLDTVITMDAEAGPLIEALGGAKGFTETASCAFDGVEKTYYYGSFYLTTYPKDGVDRVSKVWFADDSVTTPEGICIGSSREEVQEAYGSEATGDDVFTLFQGNSILTILLDKDKVISVQYELMME